MVDDYIAAYSRDGRIPLLKAISSSLETEVHEALSDLPHIDRISFRVKEAISFAKKAVDTSTTPPYTNPITEIEDQVAGRVIVFFREDINIVKNRLVSGTFTTVEQTHKRPTRDEEFGYESHHVICNIPPQVKPKNWDLQDDLPPTFELQIRTIFMHAYAEPQHDLVYKGPDDLPKKIRKELAWIAASAWGADEAYLRFYHWYCSIYSRDKLKGR